MFRRTPRIQTPPDWLVVGLGNPGPDYAHTRHNAGFDVLHQLARQQGWVFRTGRDDARLAEGTLGGVRVLLSTPITFMNRSGMSVRQTMNRLKLTPDRLIVVVDDVALPLGRLRLRLGGSAGGHNGLKSIIACLGTQEFARVRIGVGDAQRGDLVDHVLSGYSRNEWPIVREAYTTAAEAVACAVTEGFEAAMNRFNVRKPTVTDLPDTSSNSVDEPDGKETESS